MSSKRAPPGSWNHNRPSESLAQYWRSVSSGPWMVRPRAAPPMLSSSAGLAPENTAVASDRQSKVTSGMRDEAKVIMPHVDSPQMCHGKQPAVQIATAEHAAQL